MTKANYDERIKHLTAYCAVQYRILEMYDSSSNTFFMMKDLSKPVIKAMRKRKERNIHSLEEISQKTEERISVLQKQKPEIADSEEVKRIMQILNEMKKEYGELRQSNNS